MTSQPGPIQRLWFKWKMLQLPWRRRWLMGYDLEGNTYWEFKDALHSHRKRRIVDYSRRMHHGDVQVPPPWMQWLRHTRFEPPTIADQQAEVYRQSQLKMLAAQADARWAAKPSALDAPDKQQPVQMLQSRDLSAGINQMNADQEAKDRAEPPRSVEESDIEAAVPTKDSPWKQAAKGNPGADWQPQTWSPAPAKRRV